MTFSNIQSAILNGKYDKDFSLLYTDCDFARSRYINAVKNFEELFGTGNDVCLFSAPGRTEVGGNHTDHQHGKVLAGSISLDIIAAVRKNDDNVIRIKSEGYDMDIVDISNLEINKSEFGKSSALIRGMCGILKQNGYNIGGFDAYATSNVLKGSGLSSSAAYEVLIGVILSHLYNNGALNSVDIAKFSQQAENNYFGKPCGLMDQMACAIGGFIKIDFKDPKVPLYEKVEFDLSDYGYSLCIVNTGGNHADLTDDYSAITEECRAVSNAMGKDFLAQVDETEFYNSIGKIRTSVGDRAVLRAIHFFSENKRVDAQYAALKDKDFDVFLKLIKKSGNSSAKYLQNNFSVSSPKEQGITLGLAITENFLGEKGAFRVHGGGFAGTIQAFVPKDLVDSYKNVIESVFGNGSCYVLDIRPIGGYMLSEK